MVQLLSLRMEFVSTSLILNFLCTDEILKWDSLSVISLGQAMYFVEQDGPEDEVRKCDHQKESCSRVINKERW